MKSISVNKYIILDFIGIIIFKLFLEYLYVYFVHAYFEYMGFTLNFNPIKYVEGWFIYLVIFMLSYRQKKHVLYISILLIFLLLISPTIILYSYKNEPLVSFYSMIIPYTVMLLMLSKKYIKIYYVRSGKRVVITLAILLVGIVLFHYIKTVGFSRMNLDFIHEYELRSSAAAIASNSGLFGYLNSWVTQTLNIFLISNSFYKKNYLSGLFFILIQVLLFGFSGHKAVLFSLVLIIGIFIFRNVENISTVIIYSMIFTNILAILYFYISNELLLPSILVRRIFFVPANLNYVYFDYFSMHDYLYWSYSILKHFIGYSYDVSPVFVIGAYLGDSTLAANTGMFGAGFMQLGIFGVIIYLLLTVLVFNLIQAVNRLPIWLVNSILIMPVLTLFISSDLPTTFLTHGMLLSILLIYLYGSPDRNGSEK